MPHAQEKKKGNEIEFSSRPKAAPPWRCVPVREGGCSFRLCCRWVWSGCNLFGFGLGGEDGLGGDGRDLHGCYSGLLTKLLLRS